MVLGSLFCLILLKQGFGLENGKKIPSNLGDYVILYQIVLIFKKTSFLSSIPFHKSTK